MFFMFLKNYGGRKPKKVERKKERKIGKKVKEDFSRCTVESVIVQGVKKITQNFILSTMFKITVQKTEKEKTEQQNIIEL